MEIDTLREFLVLAEKRSYAATADALFISPSALSRHIAALENHLEVELFQRNSRSVTMTRHGKMLQTYAQKLVQTEDEYLKKLDETKRAEGNGIRVGAFFGISSYGIMSQIVGFLRKGRDVALSVQSEEQERLLQLLKEGEYDFVLVQEEGPAFEDGFARLTVAMDCLAVVLPQDHLLAGAESIRLSQLRAEDFLLQPSQRLTYRLMQDAFNRAGYTPNQAQLNLSGIGIVELVEQGFGIALAQEKVARTNLVPGVAVVPLEPQERIWINLVWRADSLSSAGKAFVTYFRDIKAGKI